MSSNKQIEYAEANQVSVLETNILHASDVIYWLNGASGESVSEMSRVETPLNVFIESQPRDLKTLSANGKLALWRNPTQDIYIGHANEADRARPALPSFNFTGEVWDPTRRFNPARFDLTLGTASGESVILYPSVLGTQKSPGGLLYGRLVRESNQSPLIWSLLELEVEISVSQSITFRAQSDSNGDFSISLKRLPPLPESITDYSATLTVTGNSSNTQDTAPDLASYTDWQLESTDTTDSFSLSLDLSVVPGNTARINSNGKTYLAAQAV
ncbi:hypothetical protein FLL45_20295 [Aliikangiella marina]|uniref:Uncharacterized protein n=1 Tax=Aliikangiella marina TaxID=1712262 RepID=A0A545T2Q9_9GAMM|nr:hypothetical protein [Aliikangiella marina]TQV71496.1 hypothetical protein FLL45_20295 [Aliikangiella marina]